MSFNPFEFTEQNRNWRRWTLLNNHVPKDEFERIRTKLMIKHPRRKDVCRHIVVTPEVLKHIFDSGISFKMPWKTTFERPWRAPDARNPNIKNNRNITDIPTITISVLCDQDEVLVRLLL